MSSSSDGLDRSCKTKNEDEGKEGRKEEDGGEEEEYGERKPMKKKSPKEPSKDEREEHEKTHMPFRDWCRHCVRGRGKEEACRKVDRGYEEFEVHMDFMFMGDEGSENTLAMLVVKERSTKAVMCSVAPRKSS